MISPEPPHPLAKAESLLVPVAAMVDLEEVERTSKNQPPRNARLGRPLPGELRTA